MNLLLRAHIKTVDQFNGHVRDFVGHFQNIPTEDVGRSVPDGVHNCAAVRLSSCRSRWLRCRIAMPDKPIGAVGVVPRWHDSIENRMPAGIEFRESSCYAPSDERIAVVEGLRTPLGSRRQPVRVLDRANELRCSGQGINLYPDDTRIRSNRRPMKGRAAGRCRS